MKISAQAIYRAGLVFTEAIERKDMDLVKELSSVLLWSISQIENAEQKPVLRMPEVTYFGNVLKEVKEDPGVTAVHAIDRLERAHKDETDAWYEMYKAERERVKALEREINELRGRGGDTSRYFESHHEYPWRKEPVAKPGNEATRRNYSGWGSVTVTESPCQ